MFESKKNNIFFKLWAWLSPIGNLVIIWEGKESLIEDFTDEEVEQSFKWTIVKFKQWVPYQTEVVNAISKNGANLIVQRAVEPCPMNWSSTTLVQSPYLFDEWDIFFMNLTAWDLYKIDEKFSTKLDIDWWIRTWLPINSIIYVNAEGEEDVLEFDPEVDSWKAILIDPLWWLKLESPSVNIWDLEEETIINENDEFILNRPWEGNKKIDAINLLRSNKEIFVAWEEITQADIDDWFNSLRYWNWIDWDLFEPIIQDVWWWPNSADNRFLYSTTDFWVWNSFTIDKNYLAKRLSVYLKKNSSSSTSNNWNLKIYSDSWLTALIHTSTSYTHSSIPWTTYTKFDFTLPDLNLPIWTYYFVITAVSTVSTSYFAYVDYTQTDVYAWWNMFKINNSNVVTNLTWYDLRFEVELYTFEDLLKLYKTDASNINKINFIWFATNPADIDENVIADTSWVHNTIIDSWDIWENFYLWSVSFSSSNITQNAFNSDAIFARGGWYIIRTWNTFTLTKDSKLSNIQIPLAKTWSPSWNVYLKIFTSAWWTLLKTSPTQIPWGTITTTQTLYTFQLEDLELKAWQYFYELSSNVEASSDYFRTQSQSWNPYAWWAIWEFGTVRTQNTWTDLRFILSYEESTFSWLWYSTWTFWKTHLQNIWKWVEWWIKIDEKNNLIWNTSASATTWGITLWNAQWYIIVNIEWIWNKKIPYYWI